MFTDLTDPPVEPVTIADVKLFLRIDHSHEDHWLTELIASARTQIEQRANLILISRSIRMVYPCCGTKLRLSTGPITELLAVRDTDDQTVNATLDTRPRPARLTLDRHHDGFLSVDLIAGYGAQPGDVPIPLRQAILLLVADAYEHRERDVGFERTSLRIDALIAPFRGPRL